MSDIDNPEISQTPDPTEPPKPMGNMWDVFNKPRERRVLDEGDPNYQPGQEQAPPTDEELMRSAAIKCAAMEDELAQLLHSFDTKNDIKIFQNLHIIKYPYEEVSFYDTSVPNNEGRTIRTSFNILPTEEAKVAGVENDRTLQIGLITDEDLQDVIRERMMNQSSTGGIGVTSYYFDEKGNYGKVVKLNKNIRMDPKRKLLYPPSEYTQVNIFESEMTAQDFEVASGALTMLKDRLLQAQGQAPTEPQQ